MKTLCKALYKKLTFEQHGQNAWKDFGEEDRTTK